MLKIQISENKREGKDLLSKLDMAQYTKKVFGMFDGEEEVVSIECENSLAGVMIDRFGKNVMMTKKDDEHFVVNVRVAISTQFLSWVIALGNGARIIGPDKVVERLCVEIDRLVEQYRK